jgi:hypothetical protein
MGQSENGNWAAVPIQAGRAIPPGGKPTAPYGKYVRRILFATQACFFTKMNAHAKRGCARFQYAPDQGSPRLTAIVAIIQTCRDSKRSGLLTMN